MILISGGCGFIGSHLVDKLIGQGEEVVVIDNLFTGSLANLNKKAHLYQENIVGFNFAKLTKTPEIIYHLAALSRVRPSFYLGEENYTVNSNGTVGVLEYAKLYGIKVVYAGSSTAEEYHLSPYSYSKWLGEQHCKFYSDCYGISTAVARFFLVYGPRQISKGEYSNVIGIFEEQKKAKLPLTITGDGKQTRDFIHVSDIVDGLIEMANGNWKGDVFNLGTGINYSINEIANMFGGEIKYIERPQREAENIQADTSFTTKNLPAWSPKINIKDYINGLNYAR